MNDPERDGLRAVVADLLRRAGDASPVGPTDSLFASGRLDSLAMVSVVMHLETAFGVDFGDIGFDVDRLDTLCDIEALVDARRG